MESEFPNLVSGIPEADVGLFTDLYELTMAAGYFREGMAAPATFSLFIRDYPPRRGFFIAAGLADALVYLQRLAFPPSAIAYLRSTGIFPEDFLDSLATVRFTGEVWAVPEGRAVFANEPLLEVTAPIIEAQLAETFLMNIVNFQTLIATKAARCVLAAQGKTLVDFGLRRTHGTDAGMKAARCSYLAGFASTSNVLAGKVYGIPIAGTMAHSYITSFPSELEAFRAWVRTFPDRSILLIDTYETLAAARKAVAVAQEMTRQGKRLVGVRLDSGDLVALSRDVRRILDEAGLTGVRIFASGGLDEDEIARLLDAGAPIDAFGVGTRLGVAADAPLLDSAYKQVAYGDRPVLKLSEKKATLAGPKQVFREYAPDGTLLRDTLARRGQDGPPGAEALLVPVMAQGRPLGPGPTLAELRQTCAAELARLPAAVRDLARPSRYEVRVSPALETLQARTAAAVRQRELG
ncbi:MAG: nicotinate phosphoribosyltransferase [Chloroflexi bacterium]|nr:nicotinate phosphoribosyltransferase [Chloroflexota bacterium]